MSGPVAHGSARRTLDPSLQERYAPAGRCFGCGPANPHGLHVASHPDPDDPAILVVAEWRPRPEHEAFDGVVNGGILGTLLDCHANWTAAWHLMRARGLDRPPTTVTLEYAIRMRRPTPSDPPRGAPSVGRRDRATIGQRSKPRSRPAASSRPAVGERSSPSSRVTRPTIAGRRRHGMFHRFLGPEPTAPRPRPRRPPRRGCPPAGSAAETATVRQIVARLEAMPPEEARYLASFAYVMSRAANADLDISDEETAVMEQLVDRARRARRVAGDPRGRDGEDPGPRPGRDRGLRRDPRVPRDLDAGAATRRSLRCCFAIEAADGTINAEEASVSNEIARELDIEADELNAIRDEYHEQLSAVQALRRAAAVGDDRLGVARGPVASCALVVEGRRQPAERDAERRLGALGASVDAERVARGRVDRRPERVVDLGDVRHVVGRRRRVVRDRPVDLPRRGRRRRGGAGRPTAAASPSTPTCSSP